MKMRRRLDNDLSPNELTDITKNIKAIVEDMTYLELQKIAYEKLTYKVAYMDKHDLILQGWLKNVDKKISEGERNGC